MREEDLPLPGAFARLAKSLARDVDDAIRDTLSTVDVRVLPPDDSNASGTVLVKFGAQSRSIPLSEALGELPLAVRNAVLEAIGKAKTASVPAVTASVPQRAVSFEKLYKDGAVSNRLYNCMKRSGIETLGKASQLSKEQLSAIQYLGIKGLRELKRLLERHGLAFSER